MYAVYIYIYIERIRFCSALLRACYWQLALNRRWHNALLGSTRHVHLGQTIRVLLKCGEAASRNSTFYV